MRNLLGGASLIALAATALGLGPAPAYAQSAKPATASQLDELVVTARKREERVQDVPMSVTALSSVDLARSNARDVKDVLRQVAGVSYAGAELGQSRYSIRGISSASPSPTVGIYLDDVSLVTVTSNFSGAIDPVFFDFSRLEVLKGPQGTLYGGNAMGGAIKYVSHAPRLDAYEADVAAGVATTAHGGPSYTGEAAIQPPPIKDLPALRARPTPPGHPRSIDHLPKPQARHYLTSTTSPPAPP